MAKPSYATGQIVSVAPQSPSGPPTIDKFRVVRRFPVMNMPDLYWIQSMADPGQRMVSVSELAAATPTLVGRAIAHLASPTDLMVPRAVAA